MTTNKAQSVTITTDKTQATIEILHGSNYKTWNEDLRFAFVMAEIDMALTEAKPADLTDESTEAEKAYHAKWSRANLKCLYVIRRTVSEHLLSGLTEHEDAKVLYDAVGERFKKSSKFEVENLMTELITMKYDNSKGVRDFIMGMVHVQTKLASHKLTIPDAFIVHHALNALPVEFTQMKIAYNAMDEEWSVNDLICECASMEEKLKREKSETSLLTTHFKPNYSECPWKLEKGKSNAPNKVHNHKELANTRSQIKEVGGPKLTIKKDKKCFYCKKSGHFKRDCLKYKSVLEKHNKEEGKGVRRNS